MLYFKPRPTFTEPARISCFSWGSVLPGTLRNTGGLWEVEAECWSGSTALGVVGHGEVRTIRRDGTQDVDSVC